MLLKNAVEARFSRHAAPLIDRLNLRLISAFLKELGFGATNVNSRQTGDARSTYKQWPIDFGKVLHVPDKRRTRPEKGHLAPDDIQNLRKLIEAATSENTANTGNLRHSVATKDPLIADAFGHCPQLPECERYAVTARPC